MSNAEYPEECKLAINALGGGGDERYELATYLVTDGPAERRTIKEELDIENSVIGDGLDALARGGIVQKSVGEELGNPETGMYRLTIFGEQVLDGVYWAGHPEVDVPKANYGCGEDE